MKKMELAHGIQNRILEREARLYGSYLIDGEPPGEMIKRYVDANRKLGIDVVPASEVGIMEFSLAHPWSIPFLDAAAGLLRPRALLRKKIYTMAAVLEASTLYTEEFLPKSSSALSLFFQLAVNAMSACIKTAIGIPMLFLVGRRSDA